jgi:hypothetical protein
MDYYLIFIPLDHIDLQEQISEDELLNPRLNLVHLVQRRKVKFTLVQNNHLSGLLDTNESNYLGSIFNVPVRKDSAESIIFCGVLKFHLTA